VRVVATDLDGTLLRPDGTVSPRTAKAVRAARAAGVHVVPVTGRPPHLTWPVAADAGLGPFGVCSNGAVTVDLVAMDVLEMVTIGAQVAEATVGMFRRLFPGVRFAAEDGGRFIYEPGFIEVAWEWSSRDERVETVLDILDAVGASCTKLVVRRPGWTARQFLAAVESEVAERGHITSSGLDWVEIGAPGISKAYAMERVCRRLGVGVSEVLAIGDNHNDLTVLGWAGRAAAPANAIPEVMAVVDEVLPSNADDGVAQLLERLVETVYQ
jgi:Cof subfamily protein (haloacid dehalogenase superfamily)